MHIAVDALGVKHSGGAIVLLDFLHAAICDERISCITVFCSPGSKRNFELPESPKIREHEQSLAESSYLHRILWFQRLLDQQCQKIDADVLLCMVGAGTAGKSCPHVTFIQQSLPFSAEFARIATQAERTRMLVLKRLMRSSCRSAKQVIVQTPTMKSWVSEQFALPAKRVSVVIPAVTPLPAPESPATRLLGQESGPKLLYVGSDSAYKNVQIAITGMDLLRQAVPNAILYLTWPPDHALTNKTGIVCLGHLSRGQLAKAYREATLLVMPSLVETVGLPIIEAMSAGLPVLAADRPYAHDIAEDAACFFDPLSAQDFVEKALCLLQNVTLRQGLIEKGRLLAAKRESTNPYQKMLSLVLDFD